MRKKVLTLIMALAMLLSLVPTVLAADFSDQTAVDNWAKEGVARWGSEGVFNGYADGSFNPKDDLTRAEAAQVLVNLLRLDGSADLSTFKDYATAVKGRWHEATLEAVVAADILHGDEKGLNPEGTVDRQMMFVMIARALGIEPAEKANKEFPDLDTAASWSIGYINALVNIGAVKGSDGLVDPLTDIDRETTAVLFDQLIGGYANEDGDEIEIDPDRLTVIVADDVTVTGTANGMPIYVTGAAGELDLTGVEGNAVVQVNVGDVTIKANPGTEIVTGEDVEGVKVNDTELKADEDFTVPGTGTTPGGSTETTTYAITVADCTGATVSVAPTSAAAGATVTVTVTPEVGYEIQSVTATGVEAVTAGADNTYTFTMPAAAVTVTVTMKAASYTVTFNANGGAFNADDPGTCPGPTDPSDKRDDATTCTDPTDTCKGDDADTCGDQGTTCPGEDNTTCGGGDNTGSGDGTTTCPGGDNWNVGSGKTTATLTVLSGDVIDFSKVAVPQWENYTFVGWYTTFNGAGGTWAVEYANGAYGTSAYKVTGNVTLYAIWKDQAGNTCYGGENNTPGSGSSTGNP